MKLFYGTGNQSKLRNMRAILAGMPSSLSPRQTLASGSRLWRRPVQHRWKMQR